MSAAAPLPERLAQALAAAVAAIADLEGMPVRSPQQNPAALTGRVAAPGA